MKRDKKIYTVHAAQGRIALGDLVEPGSTWSAEKEDENTVVLTRVVVVPASEVPKE
jgi:hypothetical protein